MMKHSTTAQHLRQAESAQTKLLNTIQIDATLIARALGQARARRYGILYTRYKVEKPFDNSDLICDGA